MATQRYISTSFWDDRWIRSINPSDRYLYLYLMTNPLTNIAGVYEITIDRIAFDTGYDERTLRPMLEKFAAAGKAYHYKDEWIIIPRWPRHQKINGRSKIKTGIDAILLDLPDDVYAATIEAGYDYEYLEEIQEKKPLEAPSSPFKDLQAPLRTLNYSDSDSDSDSDLDSDTDSDTDLSIAEPSAPPEQASAISPLKDDLANLYQKLFTEEVPAESWGNVGKERKACNDLAKRTRQLSTVTEVEPEHLAPLIVQTYQRLRHKERASFWKTAAYTPSALSTSQRWDAVVEAMRATVEEEQRARENYMEIPF